MATQVLNVEQISDLDTLCKATEETMIGLNWVEYGQGSGLKIPEDEKNKDVLSKQMEDLAKRLLFLVDKGTIPRSSVPTFFINDCIYNSNKSVSFPLQMEIEETRNHVIAKGYTTNSGKAVTLNTWRTFNKENLQKPEVRDPVFHLLIEDAYRLLGPKVSAFFDASRKNFAKYNMTAFDAFAVQAGATKEKIIEIIKKVGNYAKKPFKEVAEELWPSLIGREPKPEDDFYVTRSAVSNAINSIFPQIEPEKLILELMDENLQIKNFVRHVAIDSRKREGKMSSPVTFPIRIPTIIKLQYIQTMPFEDTQSGLHEMGHSADYASISPDRPYWDKYTFNPSAAEVFSILFEGLATDSIFLKKKIGLKDDEKIRKIQELSRFHELHFMVFYPVNSLVKIAMFEDGLSVDQAVDMYEKLSADYGLPLPGKYWLAHHVVPQVDFIYSPSYILANIRAADMRGRLVDKYGDDWWQNKEAGQYLVNNIFEPGNSVNLDDFSNLNSDAYFKEVGVI
jgi:hypothetical protein